MVTSSLTFAEANRAVVRTRRALQLSPESEAATVVALERVQGRCIVLPVSDDVLSRAGRPFPVEPIRTLGAVHLATLEMVAGAPQLATIITRDKRIRANAKALGYVVA